MNAMPLLVGLGIRSPLVTPSAANFIPQSWPPHKDFPVIVGLDEKVISRYGDAVWDLTLWNGKRLTINFGDGKPHKNIPSITSANADLLRRIVAWWLWGPEPVQTASTLWTRFGLLRCLFVLCSEHGIAGSDLMRFPKVAEQLPARLHKSLANHSLALLQDLWQHREVLGFVLLDDVGLKYLATALPDYEGQQTPYIPPRIWLYQVGRLRECLDDFLNHKEGIEACFRFCLDAYAKNAGSLAAAFKGLSQGRRPFDPQNVRLTGERTGSEFHGPFRRTAEQFEIDKLLEKWVATDRHLSIKAFSSYLTLTSYVGMAYLLNFSLMRIDEGSLLRTNCHSVERDESGEDIHLLQSETSKTIEDDDARWITSPSSTVAVDAMRCVAQLRMMAGAANPALNFKFEEIENPLLLCRAHEPWAGRGKSAVRKRPISYSEVVSIFTKLFDPNQLRITSSDIKIARLINPDLDPTKFAIGMVWTLAWHQLRRSGAVNMRASGIVGDASVQYQLKHVTRAMSRYYGQNYYHLKVRLNQTARGEYVRTMYEMIAREFPLLATDRFVSPHGEKRKAQILSVISEKDHRALVTAGKAGTIVYRETFLGGCANPGPPCPMGGITNIISCMGGDCDNPCEHVLIDRQKHKQIMQLGTIISKRLRRAEQGSPLNDSLQAQLASVEKSLDVIDAV